EDIERYLEGRPVLARPDRLTYRFGKFARRRRVPIAVALLLAAISLIALRNAASSRADRIQRDLADAQLAAARGLPREALRILDGGLKLDPKLPDARLLRARLLIDSGKADKAAAEARKVLEKDPSSWSAHLVLALAGRATQGESIAEHLKVVEAQAG